MQPPSQPPASPSSGELLTALAEERKARQAAERALRIAELYIHVASHQLPPTLALAGQPRLRTRGVPGFSLAVRPSAAIRQQLGVTSISIIANGFTDDDGRPQLEAALRGPDGLLPAGAHPALPHDSVVRFAKARDLGPWLDQAATAQAQAPNLEQ